MINIYSVGTVFEVDNQAYIVYLCSNSFAYYTYYGVEQKDEKIFKARKHDALNHPGVLSSCIEQDKKKIEKMSYRDLQKELKRCKKLGLYKGKLAGKGINKEYLLKQYKYLNYMD